MKNIAFLLCFVLLFSVFAFAVPADDSEVNAAETAANNGELSTLQIGIAATIMFIVISVIGVMFLKIVIKNKNNMR